MPNQFLDLRGRVERNLDIKKRDGPAQGFIIQNGHVCNKFLEGPFLFAGGTIAGKPGVRYFLHAAFITAMNTAAGTGTVARWIGYLNGTAIYFCTVLSEANVQRTVGQSEVINVLLDENMPITVNQAGTWTATNMGISYAEILTENA